MITSQTMLERQLNNLTLLTLKESETVLTATQMGMLLMEAKNYAICTLELNAHSNVFTTLQSKYKEKKMQLQLSNLLDT